MEIIRHPITKKEVILKGNYLFSNNEKVGQYIENENRYDWIKFLEYEGIDNRVLKEIAKYDAWANDKKISTEPVPPDFNIDQYSLYAQNDNFKNLDVSIANLIKDAAILDIGGSCIDSSRFLALGAKELHQVEVSAMSQKLGLERTKAKTREFEKKELMFHTCPAEYLPFKNESFDFVFSRSSIHHTMREKSIPEISRVLKEGGEFLFFEPVRSPMVLKAIQCLRDFRGIDRGTDMPLTTKDFKMLANHFTEVRSSPSNILLDDLYRSVSWFTKLYASPPVAAIYGKK